MQNGRCIIMCQILIKGVDDAEIKLLLECITEIRLYLHFLEQILLTNITYHQKNIIAFLSPYLFKLNNTSKAL